MSEMHLDQISPETAGLTNAQQEGVQLQRSVSRKRKDRGDDSVEDKEEESDPKLNKDTVLAMLMGSETEGRANQYWACMQTYRQLARHLVFDVGEDKSLAVATTASIQRWLLTESPGAYWPPCIQPVRAHLVNNQMVFFRGSADSCALLTLQDIVQVGAMLESAMSTVKFKHAKDKETDKHAWAASMQLAALVRLRSPKDARTVWCRSFIDVAWKRGKHWQDWLCAMVAEAAQGKHGAFEAQVVAQAVASLNFSNTHDLGHKVVTEFCLNMGLADPSTRETRLWWALGVRLLVLKRVFDCAPVTLEELEQSSLDFLVYRATSTA